MRSPLIFSHPHHGRFEALGGKELLFPEYLADFCHPNDAGYTAMATEIREALLERFN